MKSNGESYDSFYARGGWRYSRNYERSALRRILSGIRGLRPGASVLELGCGIGFHSALLAEQGFNVVGVDSSAVGIQAASKSATNAVFVCSNAADYIANAPRSSFDLVFSRGMSWFHYDFEARNKVGEFSLAREMTGIMELLVPTGSFLLQVCTDFSGSHEPGGERNHTRDQLRSFFEKFGEFEIFTDWNGTSIEDTRESELALGVVLSIRKS